MSGERLVILIFAQSYALIVERGQSAIEYLERREFFFFGRGGRESRHQQQKENAKVRRESRSAAHADESYFPIPRLVTR